MKFRRTLSLLLVVCMCVSFFPGEAFAEGSTGEGTGEQTYVARIGEVLYESLTAAVEAAVSQDTIVLIADSVSDKSIEIPSGKVIRLDLNGFTFTSTAPDQAILIHGVLVVEGSAGCILASDGTACAIRNEGDMEITGGTVSAARCAIYTTGESATNLAGGRVISTAQSPAENPLETYAIRSDAGLFTLDNADVEVSGSWGAVAIEGGIAEIKSGSFDGGQSNGLYVKNAAAAENSEYQVYVKGGTFTGAQAVYSDLDCHALSVTGGSFSSNPGSHVTRGYAAGRRDVESPYLVGEVTAYQEENRAVIQPAGEEDPFNLNLKFDEESAGFAPGSVNLVKLAKEASEVGVIVGETTELTAYVDVVGPEQGEWDISYTVSPFWAWSHDVGRTLVNCFTDETEITVRLSMSLLEVQEGDLVLATGEPKGEAYSSKTQVLTVQYDYNHNYPYVDFVCTASPEWIYDWSFRRIENDDYIAGVIDSAGGYAEYKNLLYAFEDASHLSGSTVVMLKDWDDECNIPIPSGSNITFDLNGKMVDSSWNAYYTLTVAADASLTVINSNPAKTGEIKGGRAALAVGENTPLTIKGGTLVGDTAGVITTGPRVEVLGGTIEGNMHGILCDSAYNTRVVVNGGTVASSGFTIAEAGSVEVYDGDVFANGEGTTCIAAGDLTVAGGAVYAYGDNAYAIASDGRITVTGGDIYAYGEDSRAILGTGYDPRDTVTVRGGRVEAEGLRSVAISGQDITIEDGEISATGELSTALNCDERATINGGSISASGNNSSAVYSLLVVTVNGGEISADGDDSAALYNDGTSLFTVTGGRFTGALKAEEQSTEYIEVSGGVFSQDPTPWLKNGWEARQNPDDQLWYVEEHVEISASWEDDYSAATLTVTHASGETETLAATVTLSVNEDHSFNITAAGEDAAGRSYGVTLENVASFHVSVGDSYSAWFPKAQDKDYAAFTVTEDMLTGLTPPAGAALDGLEKDGTVYPVGSAVQITGDAVFTARWRSTWAQVNQALAAGQKITLLNDIAPEEGDLYLYVPADAKPALDLGGHTINRALTGAIADGWVLRVDGGLTLSGGTITSGNNAGNGGGLFVNSSGSVEASDMAFTENYAANGGGVYVADGGAYSQDGGSITENHAVSYGGGLYIGGDGLNSGGRAGLQWPPGGGNAGVRNVEIIHNYSGLDGGGVYINKNSLEVDDGSQIINNKVGDSNNNIGVADGLENPLLLPANPSGAIMLGFPALVASTPAWAWATFIGIPALVLGTVIYIFWDGNAGEQGQTCNHPSWKSDGAWWEDQYYSSVKEVETCTRCGMTREEERVPAISVDEKTNITTYTVKLSDGTEDKREVGPYTVVLDTGMDPEAFIMPEGYSHTKTITIPHTRHQALSFPLSSELLWLPFDSTGPEFKYWLINGKKVDAAQFDGGNDEELITVLIDWLYPVQYEHGADGKLDKLDPVSGNPPQDPNPSFVPPNTMHTILPNLPLEKGWQRTFHRFDGWEESTGAQIDIKGGLLSFAYSYAGVAPGVPHKQAGEQIMINKPTGINAQWITPWADLARALNYSVTETAMLVTDIPAFTSDSTISIKQGRIAELQLNGFSLLGLGPASPVTFNIITVGQNAVLTVTDAGSSSPGGLKTGYSIFNGGGVKVASDGKFILQGADICDNLTLQQTYIDPQGHEIKSGDCHGGGVFIDKEGQFDMFSGRIRDNLAFGSGGGVYISEDSLFEMKGGSIIDNKAKWTSEEATTQGGGVYVGGTFKVSGKVMIKDNTVDGEASNVYLPTGKLISVAGNLDGEAELHVTMQTPGVFTSGLNANGGDQARGSTANFVSDDPNYIVVINEAGEAALESKPLSVSVELGIQHGRVGPSRMASEGETIALNVVPNEHYRLKANSLKVSYTEGGQAKTILPTPGTGEYEGKYVFTMPGTDVTVAAEFEVAAPFFAGYDLALDGVLSLRYYMLLPADFDPTGCSMSFTIEDKTQTVPYAKSRDMTIDGVTYRVFDCAVYAYQMAENIEAVFLFGGGAAVTNSYTVKQYLDTLDMSDYPEVVKDLITATRAYGHFIQPYLYELHHIPHTPLDYEGAVDVDKAKAGAADYALDRFINSEYVSSAQYYLSVSDSTALNVVITLKEGVPGEVSVRLDGAACTPIVSGSTYKIVIPSIAANNLGEKHRLVITAGNALLFSTDNLSAMAYVNTMLNYSDSQNELNALTALYDYYIAAKNYNENPDA